MKAFRGILTVVLEDEKHLDQFLREFNQRLGQDGFFGSAGRWKGVFLMDTKGEDVPDPKGES